MKAKMPVFLDAMLRVSLVDVYETLRKVVHRVLADESVDMDARRPRAAARRAIPADAAVHPLWRLSQSLPSVWLHWRSCVRLGLFRPDGICADPAFEWF